MLRKIFALRKQQLTEIVRRSHLVIPAEPAHGVDSDRRDNDGAENGPDATLLVSQTIERL